MLQTGEPWQRGACARPTFYPRLCLSRATRRKWVMPKTSEEWLAATQPQQKIKGSLKLFLGYAPGVGKTFAMLGETIRRHSRGEDVVIGIVESHGRKGT